jgi:hypothetical protein
MRLDDDFLIVALAVSLLDSRRSRDNDDHEAPAKATQRSAG